MTTLIRHLYSLLMWLAQPLVRHKLRRRARSEPRYAHAVAQRFGHQYPGVTPQADRPLLWVHAVSLGETRTAALLIAALRTHYPAMRLLLTHGTATGWEQGRALLQEGDLQTWQPWDSPACVQRFLAHFQPRLGLLMETEVWPNMAAACAKAHIPLCLVNARMSEKSLRQAQRLGWLSRPAYAALPLVLAQTTQDAARLQMLGATVQAVTGNLKFDARPDAKLLAQGHAWRKSVGKPVLLFAVSREGEEQMLINALAQQPLPGVQWLIVPRHPQRFDAVAALFQAAGYAVSRRSTWDYAPPAADLWLGDSLGEMPLYYALSDMALLGGSFAPLGGHNLIEAAACSCPVLMGPHTFNFAQAAQMAQAAGAALRCANLPAALQCAQTRLADAKALEQLRQTAYHWSQSHSGAVERTVGGVAGVGEVLLGGFAKGLADPQSIDLHSSHSTTPKP